MFLETSDQKLFELSSMRSSYTEQVAGFELLSQEFAINRTNLAHFTKNIKLFDDQYINIG